MNRRAKKESNWIVSSGHGPKLGGWAIWESVQDSQDFFKINKIEFILNKCNVRYSVNKMNMLYNEYVIKWICYRMNKLYNEYCFIMKLPNTCPRSSPVFFMSSFFSLIVGYGFFKLFLSHVDRTVTVGVLYRLGSGHTLLLSEGQISLKLKACVNRTSFDIA